MSRIGRMPIELPAGVEVKIDGHNISVKGPKGELSMATHPNITVTQEGNVLHVTRPNDLKENRSLHGLTRSLVHNMVVGVTEGFEKALTLEGVGYRAQKQGKKLVLTVGYSHPVEFEEPEGITFETPAQTRVVIKGIDRQKVGNVAATIRKVREPEPYLGKGIRYENEHIRRKEGKTGKK